MIDYRFNEWRISGEKAPELSKRAYQLLRSTEGVFSAQQVGEVLYLYYVKQIPKQEIRKRFNFMPQQIVTAIFSNRFNVGACTMFFEMLEHEPEMLELLFSQSTN
ncbi:hypothetical protein [Priestia aryabhattai]|uniref:hypothetical protein n=1 Tax=Priestia aryabhattai TaxID=412384 RepID=UPI0015F48E1E|nr:hypothetical protein [Priestia aryabhattai]